MDRFISEEEVDQIRKKKQEEWEKKRTVDQPLVRPEEPADHRSLAERLQENADKKQAEFEEKFALKNMIYTGMDDDEFEHVEKLAQAEYDRTVERYKREGEEIKEFRKKLRVTPAEDRDKDLPAVKLVATTRKPKGGASALKALAASIRKKPVTAVAGTAAAGTAGSAKDAKAGSATAGRASPEKPTRQPAAPAAPSGLVAYGSSDDDDSDTESEDGDGKAK